MQGLSRVSIVRPLPILNRLWLVAFVAALLATGVDLLIANIATPIVYAPADYPSFTALPILAGCLLGAMGGCAVFTLLSRRVRRPIRWFVITAVGVLLTSYLLPILPIVNPLPRFAGVNWGIAFTLMFMHTVTAGFIVSSLIVAGKPSVVEK